MKKVYLVVALYCSFISLNAQGFIFGPKLGATVGFQQWNGVDREALLSSHAALFIESYDEESTESSLYAQLGYMRRGSAIRAYNFFSGNQFSSSFIFNNVGLEVGAKRLLSNEGWKPYYFFGVRLEYTVNTNLDEYEEFNSFLFYPVDIFVNKWNYGLSIGGGFQKELSELYGAAFEISISPDVSKQYEQPAINSPITLPTGQVINIGQRDVRNLTLEARLVLRFRRKIEYY